MAQTVNGRVVTAEARIQSQASPCNIYGGQSGTGTGFSPTTSVFPCQYHSTSTPYTYSSARSFLTQGQTGESWEPSNKLCSFGNRGALDRQVLPLFVSKYMLLLPEGQTGEAWEPAEIGEHWLEKNFHYF